MSDPTMTDDEFTDALMGIYAYDRGSVCSGIHDERLRARVIAELHRGAQDLVFDRLRLSRIVREQFLTEEALAQQYGIEDVKHFIDWLSERMDYDL